MAESTTLIALQTFHRSILAIKDGRPEGAEVFADQELISVFERELQKIWEKPMRDDALRDRIKTTRTVTVNDENFQINDEFLVALVSLSDEADLHETEASRCLLDAQEDPSVLGRSLLECAIIRYHQERKFLLDSIRIAFDLDEDSEVETSDALEAASEFVSSKILANPTGAAGTSKTTAGRCLDAMKDTRTWLNRVLDKVTTASMLAPDAVVQLSEQIQALEFTRVTLFQQHELLSVILSRIIDKRAAREQDFDDFLPLVKKADKYEILLVHCFPILGSFITAFGSPEGQADLLTARKYHDLVCPLEESLALPYVQAATRAWWLAEYSGHYLEGLTPPGVPAGFNGDEEDKKRSKQFSEALKDGAFDFLLSLAADVKSQDWQDPARTGMRQWLQRKAPALSTDGISFSEPFQKRLMMHLETFVDAFITNLPDMLRKLRVEEDEQRQLSQTHEHDLDLERFLIIIAYSYEGRPDAAMNFWSDPESNLAGFMHWASRRASTPLVTAFCEMLQALSENDECATAAHQFLLDEGHQSSGKMRRSLSLTWSQIFKELVFFSNKIREKPSPSHTHTYRTAGKPSSDQAEAEPESVMMLECYLRLITKLSAESETTRQFLLKDAAPSIIEILFQLASSQIPARLRACAFFTLEALLSRKSEDDGHNMWQFVDAWIAGGHPGANAAHHRTPQAPPSASMERIFEDMGRGFEEPFAFVRLLTTLIAPSSEVGELNDALSFPENLGSSYRMPGVEMYVDFVLGTVFSYRSKEVTDVNQLRMLRLSCLDFALMCLSTFNEHLIVLANTTNLALDDAIATTDLPTYVRLHPFARVMEWMFNDKVMAALFDTIHQNATDVVNAPQDSPIILGILRGVEVVSKILELQTTYLDLVRPALKIHSTQRPTSVANAAYASFEDGLVTRLGLIVDLGSYCGIGHAEVTLACLKLLGSISASSKMASIWSAGLGHHSGRNKAIVALETNGENESIARSLIYDMRSPLDPSGESESPGYLIKVFVLEFLFRCLSMSPRKPTIAHLLLGFKCHVDDVDTSPTFDSQLSLFHVIMQLAIETPCQDATGMRQWTTSLRSKAMRVLRILWSSPLTSAIVVPELRDNEFLFHLLMRDTVIQPALTWEGSDVASIQFPLSDGAIALADFLSMRSMGFEYCAIELCSIAQNRLPTIKRRIFEAFGGQVRGDGDETIAVPTIFDFYDFLLPDDAWTIPHPRLALLKDLDFDLSLEADSAGTLVYNIDRVKEVLLLRRGEGGEGRAARALVSAQDLEALEKEEARVIEFLEATNRRAQVLTASLGVLRAWTKLLLVMIECNDFKGTAQTSFFLQALQAILPSLEAYSSTRPQEAAELAKLARILLFKLEFSTSSPADAESISIGNLVSEKLSLIFQICLSAIGKWAGNAQLRSIYYSICFRYLTGLEEHGSLAAARKQTAKSVYLYGERLLNVVCDDACGGEPTCQTSAMILLNGLVSMSAREGDTRIIDTLNRLNFIGVIVDSLRSILEEGVELTVSGNTEHQNYLDAKLALILQLSQTREGAKHVVSANLFRTLQQSSLFAADPELQVDPSRPAALEQLYGLLVKVARIIGAAIVSRGSHNVMQGRRFLTEHRMLVMHTLKRSAGIGPAEGALADCIQELADAFMVLIVATEFLDFEEEIVAQTNQNAAVFYH